MPPCLLPTFRSVELSRRIRLTNYSTVEVFTLKLGRLAASIGAGNIVSDTRRSDFLVAYPDVSLQAAREKREEFRKQHSSGVDPGLARKEEKNARLRSTNFEVLARKWHSTFF